MNIKIKCLNVVLLTIGLVGVAGAVGDGLYVGGQVGPSNVDSPTRTASANTPGAPNIRVSPSNTGIGERFFFGYNINEYAAVELGFSHYGESSYNVPDTANACSNPTVQEGGFDVAAKGILPVANSGLGVFGKVGFALMAANLSSGLSTKNNTIGPCGGSTNGGTSGSARPLIGVGVSYDISQRWVADLSWTHVSGSGNVASADMIALGVSYHWTDLYCGQFLC